MVTKHQYIFRKTIYRSANAIMVFLYCLSSTETEFPIAYRVSQLCPLSCCLSYTGLDPTAALEQVFSWFTTCLPQKQKREALTQPFDIINFLCSCRTNWRHASHVSQNQALIWASNRIEGEEMPRGLAYLDSVINCSGLGGPWTPEA